MDQLLDMPWGWMFVPRKPHPFGNEYHSICYAEMMIVYAIELVEGSDMLPQRPWDPNERLGKTVGLLLHLCKSIYSRSFVMILDSGFCVLQGIVELQKKGVLPAMDAEKMKGKTMIHSLLAPLREFPITYLF
jgi:hypothetical protein